MTFSKSQFINTIEAIKGQFDYDKKKTELLENAFETDVNPYDNSRLVNAIFKLLHNQFEPKDNRCEIQAFCFDYDFGRALQPKMSIEELWKELTNTN